MNILVDYENVNVNGIYGIDALNTDDTVEIFYSDKNNKMDMDVVAVIYNSPCKVLLKKTDKSAPNYLDFQVVCRSSQILNAESQIAIISKDKGYISVKDFYEKGGKSVILAESISEILAGRIPAQKNTLSSLKVEAQEEDMVSAVPEPVKPKKVSRISQKKKLSDEDKQGLKEALKDLPKHNGKLQQSVIDCFNECNTLGEMHFKLVSDIGRCDGEKAYKIIESKFAEFKGLAVKV